ncbi:imidazole glycerol phosphate synthase cyclase subunit [Candidatus Pelagibacter sp.]|nr:imidazole glycerol phosphate synthase cyclase subunit [Candidatus Pelagibacter sp.]
MSRTRILSKIEIKNGEVVKPIFFEGVKKIGSPINIANDYYKKGIDEIILIDIVRSLYKQKPNFSLLKKISKEIFVPLTYGGGITTIKDIENCLKNGADKVSINSSLLPKNSKFINQAIMEFGSQCIIVNIDAKKIYDKWYCYTDGGRINSNIEIIDWLDEVQEKGCGEIFLQSIDKDGFYEGPDYELYKLVNKKIQVPLIFSSGIRKYSDITKLKKILKPDAIAISSAFHFNELQIKKIKKII